MGFRMSIACDVEHGVYPIRQVRGSGEERLSLDLSFRITEWQELPFFVHECMNPFVEEPSTASSNWTPPSTTNVKEVLTYEDLRDDEVILRESCESKESRRVLERILTQLRK